MSEVAKFDKTAIPAATAEPYIPPSKEQAGEMSTPNMRNVLRTPAPQVVEPAPVQHKSQALLNFAKGITPEGVVKGALRMNPLVAGTDALRPFFTPGGVDEVIAGSPTLQAIDKSMQSTFDDRGNVYGISDSAAQNITAARPGNFMPSTPGAETTADIIAENAAPSPDGTIGDSGLTPNDRQPGLRPEGDGAKPTNVFTNIPGYAEETGGVLVDDSSGQNVYTRNGEVTTPGAELAAGGPRPGFQGNNRGLTAFTPRPEGGSFEVLPEGASVATAVQPDGSVGYVIGEGGGELGLRGMQGQVDQGAPATGAPAASGAAFDADAQTAQTVEDLNAGRVNMENELAASEARLPQLLEQQKQVQAQMRGATPEQRSSLNRQQTALNQQIAATEQGIEQQKTALAFQPSAANSLRAAKKITDRQGRAASGEKNGYTANDEIEQGIIDMMPDMTTATRAEELGLFHRQEKKLREYRNQQRLFGQKDTELAAKTKTAEAAANANKRTDAQEALTLAQAKEIMQKMDSDNSTDFSGFKPDPMDPSGKGMIGTGIIAGYPVDWPTAQGIMAEVARRTAFFKSKPANKGLKESVLRRKATATVVEEVFAGSAPPAAVQE